MRGQDSSFETFTYQYLDLLKGPVKDLIKMSSDDFLIRRVCVAAIPALSQFEGGNRFDAEIQVITYCRQAGQEFLPSATKRFKKSAEAQLSPYFSQVVVKFHYEPFLFPSMQDIEILHGCLGEWIEGTSETIVKDTYDYLMELLTDPRYTTDFDHYRKHRTEVYNALSFILWPNIHHITGDKPSNLDVCGKDDKTRMFIKVLREKSEAFKQNNLLTGLRHSIKIQDQVAPLFEVPFNADQDLTSLRLDINVVPKIFRSKLDTKQKILLLELLKKMLETLNKRIETANVSLKTSVKLSESFLSLATQHLKMKSFISNDAISRICGHDLLNFRHMEIKQFVTFVKEQSIFSNQSQSSLNNLLAHSKIILDLSQEISDTLSKHLKPKNEAVTERPVKEKKQDVPAATETLERPPVNAVTMPTTFFNPVTNYNKEVRARLREIQIQSSKHSPTVAEPVTIPVNNPEQASLFMVIGISNGVEFNIDMRTLSEPNGSAFLIQIRSTLVKKHMYVFMRGLIELTKQELEWLQAADGRPLLTQTGHDANGLKLSPHYHALVLKRTVDQVRIIFHYLDVKQEGQNCRVFFPVRRLSHDDYDKRFYLDTSEYQHYWSDLREELGRHVAIRLTTQITETPPPNRPRP